MRNLFLILTILLTGWSCSQKTTPTVTTTVNCPESSNCPPVLVTIDTLTIQDTIKDEVFIFHPLDKELGFTTKESSLNNTDTLIYLLTEPCYGRCPHVEYLVFQNGVSLYNGHRFVDRFGKWKSEATPEVLSKIHSITDNNVWLDYDDHYPSHNREITDFPKITIHCNNRTISYRHEEPLSLANYTKELLKILEKIKWGK